MTLVPVYKYEHKSKSHLHWVFNMLKAFTVVAAFASLLVSAVPHTPYVRWVGLI